MKITIIVFAIISLSSCTKSADVGESKELLRIANLYYQSEKIKDWPAVYKLRTPRFRKGITLKDFQQIMESEDKGWKFHEYQIKGVSVTGNTAKIEIIFKESAPKEFFAGVLPPDSGKIKAVPVENKEYTQWLKRDGQWYAYSPGSRMRLSLNSPQFIDE